MSYNKFSLLFISSCIFIYIIINTNILQVLLFSTQESRSGTSGVCAIKKCVQGVGSANMPLPHIALPEQGGYSAAISAINTTDKICGFGSTDAMSDRPFFYEKRLIAAILCVNFQINDSIVVWKQGIYGLRQSIRGSMLWVLGSHFDSSISDLSSRLLLGEPLQGLSRVNHLIKVTGTQHLFAISGFNLTFVISFFSISYKWFLHKRHTAVLNFAIVLGYFWLITLSFSLVRALSMSFFAIFSKQLLDRQYSPLLALLYTIIIIFLIDKSILLSISFQLSFAATLGIVLYAAIPNTQNSLIALFLGDSHVQTRTLLLGSSTVVHYFVDSLKVSVVAQLSVLPLLLYHFDEMSILTLPVTIIAGWLFPLVLSVGFISIMLCLPFFSSSELTFLLLLPFNFILDVLLILLDFLSLDQSIIKYTMVPLSTVYLLYAAFSLVYLIYFYIQIEKRRRENAQVANVLF